MFQGKLGGILNDFFGGFGAIIETQDHMRSTGSHGVQPKAFPMRVIRDDPFIRKRVLPKNDEIPFVLEIQYPAVVFRRKVIAQSLEERTRH